MIFSIYIYYVFKFSPKIIDSKSPWFWRWSVDMLNNQRRKTGEAFYLFRWGKLYIRDPFIFPVRSHWTCSDSHPFCWYIGNRVEES